MSNKIVFIVIIGLLLTCAPAKASLPVVALAKAGLLDNLPKIQIMPDNPVYVLKAWYEKIITFISFGDAKKAERYSKLAEKRLKEAEQMAKKGKEGLTKKALEEYEKYLNKAISKTDEIKKQAMETTKQKAKEQLNQVIDKVSEKIKALIANWAENFGK